MKFSSSDFEILHVSLRPPDVRTLTPVEPRCGCRKLVSAYLYRRGTSFPATFVPSKFFESAPLKKLSRLKVGSDDDFALIRENYQSPVGVFSIFGSPPLSETNFARGSCNSKLVDDRTEQVFVRFSTIFASTFSGISGPKRVENSHSKPFFDRKRKYFSRFLDSRRGFRPRRVYPPGFVPLRHRLRVADRA